MDSIGISHSILEIKIDKLINKELINKYNNKFCVLKKEFLNGLHIIIKMSVITTCLSYI